MSLWDLVSLKAGNIRWNKSEEPYVLLVGIRESRSDLEIYLGTLYSTLSYGQEVELPSCLRNVRSPSERKLV